MSQDNLAVIEQFLDALWLERNLAENTLASYRLDLKALVEWLTAHDLNLENAQAIDLQSFLGERIDGGYKAASSARLLSAMRRLFQYLYREKSARTIPLHCCHHLNCLNGCLKT